MENSAKENAGGRPALLDQTIAPDSGFTGLMKSWRDTPSHMTMGLATSTEE
jgi:hypothetical protein